MAPRSDRRIAPNRGVFSVDGAGLFGAAQQRFWDRSPNKHVSFSSYLLRWIVLESEVGLPRLAREKAEAFCKISFSSLSRFTSRRSRLSSSASAEHLYLLE